MKLVKNKRQETQSLEDRIYNLIQQLLVEKSQSTNEISYARHLRPSETLNYIKMMDPSLGRKKNNLLEKPIEKVLMIIKEEEAEELNESDIKEVDENGNELMTVVDKNIMNKNIINLWNTSITTTTTTAKEPKIQSTETENERDRKSKKRTKHQKELRSAKRQKGMLFSTINYNIWHFLTLIK